MEEEVNTGYYWPAFVDFMVVLFFIALAIAGHMAVEIDQIVEAHGKDSSALGTANRKLDGLKEFQRVVDELKQVRDNLQYQLAVNNIRIDTLDKKKIKLSGDFCFETDSFNLKPTAKDTVILIGMSVKKVLDSNANYDRYTFIIEGHTDNTGDEGRNNTLSYQRAFTITKLWATECGLKVPVYEILPTGFGQWKPTENNYTSTNRASNRRIEITIIPKFSEFTRLMQTTRQP